MELVTITDNYGITPEKEPLVPGLFPGADPLSRPNIFPDKKIFFLSARVHPGESPAQWMWDGEDSCYIVLWGLRHSLPHYSRGDEIFDFGWCRRALMLSRKA